MVQLGGTNPAKVCVAFEAGDLITPFELVDGNLTVRTWLGARVNPFL